jgi:hypothetical protein
MKQTINHLVKTHKHPNAFGGTIYDAIYMPHQNEKIKRNEIRWQWM